MTWKDVLDLGPTAISRLIGCPVPTASNWIRRKKGPGLWLQKLVIEAVERASPNTALEATARSEPSAKAKRKPRSASA